MQIKTCIAVALFALGILPGGMKAQTGNYQPNNPSLSQHPLPKWYDDAKLGIFIHWGLYSVPGWAKGTDKTFEELMAGGSVLEWFNNNPYAEWYLNSLKLEGSTTRAYHEKTFGADFPYDGFVPMFNAAIKKWDPQEWAKIFREAGAGYVVLTTKHHDGFTLWPSRHPNPFKSQYAAERDLVGELSQAVSANGMKMGLYYSSGLDWTFNPKPIKELMDLFTGVPQQQEYVRYVENHWRELMERYNPFVLWADIGSPQAFNPANVIADFYNRQPEGVVNDRHKMEMSPTGFGSAVYYDFNTPEYRILDSIASKKWETCRGIGKSFGYNQLEDAETFLSVEELIESFVDIVSKNGNLLLNIGPRADGSIPQGQLERLQGLGAWLKVNGEAIYGTRPWNVAMANTATGERVRFTRKDGSIYLILLDTPKEKAVQISGLPLSGKGGKITDLATGKSVKYSIKNGVLHFSVSAPASAAHAFRLSAK
jgi:alpha-L-fucosidase